VQGWPRMSYATGWVVTLAFLLAGPCVP